VKAARIIQSDPDSHQRLLARRWWRVFDGRRDVSRAPQDVA
jgi:hypothetical protein